jgi:hypothetical protein
MMGHAQVDHPCAYGVTELVRLEAEQLAARVLDLVCVSERVDPLCEAGLPFGTSYVVGEQQL